MHMPAAQQEDRQAPLQSLIREPAPREESELGQLSLSGSASDVSTESSDVVSDPGDFDLIRSNLVRMYVNIVIRKAARPHLVACVSECRVLQA